MKTLRLVLISSIVSCLQSIIKIDGGVTKDNNYNYQRGVIFSNNNIDYGLYIAGGELYLKEINE